MREFYSIVYALSRFRIQIVYASSNLCHGRHLIGDRGLAHTDTDQNPNAQEAVAAKDAAKRNQIHADCKVVESGRLHGRDSSKCDGTYHQTSV